MCFLSLGKLILKKKNMKRKFNLTKYLNYLYYIVIIAVIASCKQDEVKHSEAILSKDVKIEQLTVYLSDLTRIDIKRISYNAKKKIFLVDGVKHISKEELEEFYALNPFIHYKDGVPVSRP